MRAVMRPAISVRASTQQALAQLSERRQGRCDESGCSESVEPSLARPFLQVLWDPAAAIGPKHGRTSRHEKEDHKDQPYNLVVLGLIAGVGCNRADDDNDALGIDPLKGSSFNKSHRPAP